MDIADSYMFDPAAMLLVGQEHYSVPKVAIPELKIDPLKIVFIKF